MLQTQSDYILQLMLTSTILLLGGWNCGFVPTFDSSEASPVTNPVKKTMTSSRLYIKHNIDHL